jgi:hypothetical protein
MDAMAAADAFFGSQTQHARFQEEFSGLMAAVERIQRTCKAILYRPPVLRTPAEGVLFLVGRQCYHDFQDVLLMCGNGRGASALRLVRSLFEKTVTATYIITHPGEAELFEKYNAVHKYKLLERAKRLQTRRIDALLDNDREITADYERVKTDFQMTNCKKCATKRLQPSWSKLDIAAMCQQIDPKFEELYFSCYLYPTLHIHSTFYSLGNILERAAKKETVADVEPEEQNLITMSLSFSCSIMMQIAHAHNLQFALGRDSDLAKCTKALEDGWKSRRESSKL